MSNNWNDPNAPQGDNNQGGGWEHQPEQNWDQGQAPADPAQPAADPSWNQGQQAGGWDQQGQPSANQGWDQNQQQPGGWDQQGQPSANQGWDQQGQPSANQGWDQNQQQAPGWDQAQGAAYGAPGAGAPGYGAPGYGAPGYGAPPMAPSGNVGPLGMPLANFGKRAYGWLFDYFLPGIVISTLASIIIRPTTTSTGGGVNFTSTNDWLSPLLTLVLWLALSYVSQKSGQTWGRKIAKTQLVGEDGRPIGLGKSFLRYVCHIIDGLICGIGWLFPLWDSKRQTLADKIMKTYVLDVSQTGPINVQP